MKEGKPFEKTTKTEIRFPTQWEKYMGDDWQSWIIDAMAEKVMIEKLIRDER